ncbi:MAG: FAD-dependent oxidoreductase [Thermofilum sp.]
MPVIKIAPCSEAPQPTGRKVAVIGSGPAGLAAAGYLACRGHEVVVYDRLPEPGGMLLFAIPEFRIPKSDVRESIAQLKRLGVRFVVNREVDSSALRELLSEYDAVLVATGTWKGRKLGIPGEDKHKVYDALDWISHFMAYKLGYRSDEPPPLEGDVGIVGAGLTAVDICELAVYEYKARPIILYRRPMSVAPAKHMLKHLEKLGVRFFENVIPLEVTGACCATGVKLARVKPTTDRKAPTEVIPGSEFELPLDALVVAVGLEATPPRLLSELGVKLNRDGTIAVDENYMTSVKGLFAAGDVVHGPSNIGLAMRSGRLAAQSIDAYLSSL